MFGLRPYSTCVAMWLVLASPLSAQSECDEDGGTGCADLIDGAGGAGEAGDAGVDDADGGGILFIGPPSVRRRDVEDSTSEPIGGPLDGGTVGAYDECSCTTAVVSADARIHLCTESFEPAVCEEFGCNRGTVRRGACEREGVRLCCEMEARGLKTHLYEDCEHPNCESGFREQCRDFGGSVSEGACDQPERPDIIDNSRDDEEPERRGFCAVGRPGASRAGASQAGSSGAGGPCGALLLLLLLGIAHRTRRRADASPRRRV